MKKTFNTLIVLFFCLYASNVFCQNYTRKTQMNDAIKIQIMDNDSISNTFSIPITVDFYALEKGLIDEASFKRAKKKLRDINAVLSSVCPPERKKISENIWKCGNGKKIKSNDKRLDKVMRLFKFN